MQCGIEKSHELGSGSLGEQRVEKRSRLGGFKRRIGEAYTREVAEDVLEPAVPLWECAIRHWSVWSPICWQTWSGAVSATKMGSSSSPTGRRRWPRACSA